MLTTEATDKAIEMYEGGATEAAVTEATGISRSEAPPEERAKSLQGRSVPREQIAQLAYSFWEARGGAEGSAFDDWLRAERELNALSG